MMKRILIYLAEYCAIAAFLFLNCYSPLIMGAFAACMVYILFGVRKMLREQLLSERHDMIVDLARQEDEAEGNQPPALGNN